MASSRKQTRLQVLLLGPCNCGRTALLEVFRSGHFPADTGPTISDVSHLTIELNGMTLDLTIWDVIGAEDAESLACESASRMDCCVLVFALDNLYSFRRVEMYMNFCQEEQRKEQKFCPFVLVGNKVDKEMDREVSWSQAQTWARSYNMPYFEVSGWRGTNVRVLLGEIAHLAFERQKGLNRLDKHQG